jgi:adenine-specific DNA methylase
MNNCKKLIEVAMPVKEISAESVRDKSIRHGHISTLHLWWARRPLPVCRAVVFASLVPDPLDKNCPQAFKDAVDSLLGKKANAIHADPYKPYEDIPWTSVVDPMEDNLRNRLMMFMGKFSHKYLENERLGKKTPAKDQLSDYSLIKWDNKNNEEIIGKARKLIFVAQFDALYNNIKTSEQELYETPDRHIENEDIKLKEKAKDQAIEIFLDHMPKVFDPFAGGGAIPLEAARLGCRSYGNDINPVAHIIQKGSVEFPQKYGKPIAYSKEAFIEKYGEEAYLGIKDSWKGYTDGKETHINIPNRLSFDVEYYAKKLLKLTEEEIGHYYPADKNGKKPIAYYWVYKAECSNPTCKCRVPLLKQFYLVNKPNKKVFLEPILKGKEITFKIKEGVCEADDWIKRKNLTCPICSNVTTIKELKSQFLSKKPELELIAIFEDGPNGKKYRLPTIDEQKIINTIPQSEIPTEKLAKGNNRDLHCAGWGIESWGDIFTSRQLLLIHTLISKLDLIKEEVSPEKDHFSLAVITYLGILIDRSAAIATSLGRWDVSRENIQSPFSKQALPFSFDFPEANLLGNTTGSILNQLEWLLRYIESENTYSFPAIFTNASSGENTQFEYKSISSTITDPPYYDAIAYADLSDFFYVWLKRSISDIYPINFAFPQTPKTEECTALKHHHNGDIQKAKRHFETKLGNIFKTIEAQTSGVISIMFAHQSTEAWTTLCNSVLNSQMNITGSWAVDTELANRSLGLANGGVLASSVTVSCRPTSKSDYGEFRVVKKAIEKNVTKEVKLLYGLGFRGADLLTACFGQAVSEFGKYEKVEKADGTEVTVAELLEMAREAAFNAIISDIDTDDVTKFYIGWLNLFGFTQAEHDDVRRITQIGLNIDINELQANNILLTNGNKQTLADYAQRNELNSKLGTKNSSYTIDLVHRAMSLYAGSNRIELLRYIAAHAQSPEGNFWRVTNSMAEILPAGCADHKQVQGLISNKESLIRESKNIPTDTSSQLDLNL